MKNKKAKPGLPAALTILSLAIIAVMAVVIVKLSADKKAGENTISELRERLASLEGVSVPTSDSVPQSESPAAASQDAASSEAPSAEPGAKRVCPSYTLDFVELGESGFVYSADANSFGWEERLWDGCSTWCSVSLFETKVTASSTLAPQGSFSYEASNTQSPKRENAWSEGVEGDGVGEFLEIEQTCLVGEVNYETDIAFTELCIVNGYAATERNWSENNRVKELKMYFDGEFVTVLALDDTIKQQYFDISQFGLKVQNGETARFKFEIGSVYPGTKYDDTCLTGLLIEFSGRTGH